MKRFNKYMTIGLLFNGLFLYMSRFDSVHDFIKGLTAGAAIGLMLLGIYAQNHDISKLRDKKKIIIKRVLGR